MAGRGGPGRARSTALSGGGPAPSPVCVLASPAAVGVSETPSLRRGTLQAERHQPLTGPLLPAPAPPPGHRPLWELPGPPARVTSGCTGCQGPCGGAGRRPLCSHHMVTLPSDRGRWGNGLTCGDQAVAPPFGKHCGRFAHRGAAGPSPWPPPGGPHPDQQGQVARDRPPELRTGSPVKPTVRTTDCVLLSVKEAETSAVSSHLHTWGTCEVSACVFLL